MSRSSWQRRPQPQNKWETSARQALREVVPECSADGNRRVLAELKRRGWRIGEASKRYEVMATPVPVLQRRAMKYGAQCPVRSPTARTGHG